MDLTVRAARPEDADQVAAFTRETWPERGLEDYLPDVFPTWVASDDERQRTLVAVDGEDVVGCVQVRLLSTDEAWCQGMRVAPTVRGRGVGRRLTDACFRWARERGAVVARNLVFSWNVQALGLSRTAGFSPVTEFRWAYPDPDAAATPDGRITADPAPAWAFWADSEASARLHGLALDLDEAWALARLTRADLARAAGETALLVVGNGRTRGMAVRNRQFERETDDGVERWAEYGATAWRTPTAAEALFAAIRRDAGQLGADRARVLIPETARTVTDAAAARVDLSDGPDVVLGADLTGIERRGGPRE